MDFYKNFPYSSINFDESFQELLEQFDENSITCIDLLSTPPIELSNKFKLNLNKLLHFIHYLKKEEINEFEKDSTSLKDLNNFSISTGDSKFDDLLNGGIFTKEITEIFGESATGKSQFIMQLTNSISNKYPTSKSVIISTEGFIETKRLIEINSNLNNILIINCMDFESQEHIFNVQLPNLLKDHDIKLVIVDSISHHLRVEFENNFKQLKQKLIEINLNLLNLSNTYNFAIVATNQISDKPIKKILDTDFKKISMDYQLGWLNGWENEKIIKIQNNEQEIKNTKVSTMGLNWDQFVDVKILITKKYLFIENQWILKRFLKLVYSNRSNNSNKVEFQINKNGLSSL